MEKKNLKLNIKRSNLLHPITEFVIGGGITLISALFTMWLCQFSCGFILTEIMTLSAFVVCFCIYAVIFAFVTVISGRLWLGNSISMVFLFAVTVSVQGVRHPVLRSESEVTNDRSDTEFVGTEHESKCNRHKPVESSFP